MNSFRAFIEQVRSRIDIVELIGADVVLRPSGSVLKGCSPFHPETAPSFVVWPTNQTWHDFSSGGGRGGDAFAYVQERKQVGFKEAVFELAERAGLRRPSGDDAGWTRELTVMNERREIERLLTVAATYYHRILPTKIRETLYRRHYGFSDQLVDEQRLGWADGHLFDHLTNTVGASRELALKTGLFIALKGGRVVDFFCDRLVFPYWRRGRAVYFIARATEYTSNDEWEQAKYKKLLTHSERHHYVSPTVRNDYLFNEDAVAGAEELLITEGVTDCLSAMQAGLRCISPVTTRFRAQDVPRLLELTRNVPRVIICNDAEVSGAGESGARDTAAALWAAGREACLAQLPRPADVDKVDVNSLVASQGPEALRAVIAEARPYPEYLVEQIPPGTPRSELERRIDPILATLVGRTAIRVDVVLDAIAERFDLRRRALTIHAKELAARERVRAFAARPADARVPQVQVSDRQLRDLVAETHRLLMRSNERRIEAATASPFEPDTAPMFVRGSSIVRLDRTAAGAPRLKELSETAVFGILAREADWVRETEAGTFAVFPPKEVARDLLAFPPSDLPLVEEIISTPSFGRAGTLLHEPGLHREDRLWFEADPTLRLDMVPEHPSSEQVAAARNLFFDDLFHDFPFVGASDRAHALAAALLPFVRRLIAGCTPLHVVEAPAVGSGKSLLCNLVSLIVTGESCDSRTLPETDEEIRKMLTAELAQARPIVLLDNANEKRTLAAAPLASVLTSVSWTDRLLGRTQMITVPNHAVWMLTGNNIRLSRDIARRSVRIRIDPKVDRAWTRAAFKHDPIVEWTKAHRAELVHAALVLIRAWLAAGRPLARERLGSFEEWAAMIGGILSVAGVEGFLGNLDELYAAADQEGEAWREFVAAWWDAYGYQPVQVAALTELCERHDLMSQVRGDGNTRSQQSRLGRAIHGARDRVFGELRVTLLARDRLRRASYALTQLGLPDPPVQADLLTEHDEWPH